MKVENVTKFLEDMLALAGSLKPEDESTACVMLLALDRRLRGGGALPERWRKASVCVVEDGLHERNAGLWRCPCGFTYEGPTSVPGPAHYIGGPKAEGHHG